MFTFGKTPTYLSEDKFDLGISDDKRAFTLTFSDMQVTADTAKASSAPVSAREFSLVLPLEGYDKNVEIEFGVNAFALTQEGGTATLVLSVNGQTALTDFRTTAEKGFVQSLKFTAESASECRISLFLLAGRDSKNAKAAALLSATTIDAEILPRPT